MSEAIAIHVTPGYDGSLSIDGYVGQTKAISLSKYRNGWSVSGSSCLPSDIELALKYIECMNRAFRESKVYKENR